MQIPMVSSDLRRWALHCIEQANNPYSSGEERERLMRMREGLLALADNQDWLNGNTRTSLGDEHNVLYIDLVRPRQS